jgi:hypothetical protein
MCATLLHAAETHLTAAGPPPPQAIHVLIAALLVTWLSVSLAGPSISPLLAYSNVHKHWWTYATDGLHSSSPTLLATGLFLSYMFGRSLENSQGPVALLLTYTLACIGGASSSALADEHLMHPLAQCSGLQRTAQRCMRLLLCCMSCVIVPAQLHGKTCMCTGLQPTLAWPPCCVAVHHAAGCASCGPSGVPIASNTPPH